MDSGSPVPAACLSVVMPCFNEAPTLAEAARRVLASPFTAELIVVDDGSDDGSLEVAEQIASQDRRVRVVAQARNRGKGAALRRGFAEAKGPFVVVQDADLEYDPADYEVLLAPLLDGRADVVFGSRFLAGRPHRVLYYWHAVGNKILTTLSNMATNLNLTDMETCYKAFRVEVVRSIEIEEDRFAVDAEITAKVARAGYRVFEVGVSYAGRTYAEGKKIGWRDGLATLACILRYSPPALWARTRLRRDRPGPDRAGPDRAGADRAGADRAGADRTERDRAGEDRAGRGLRLGLHRRPEARDGQDDGAGDGARRDLTTARSRTLRDGRPRG